ncbi:6-pyruvoyl tetrahydrobiopterin synthase [Caldimicrobium thiodismutans]|jgi:6-pyruvoyltetrahydropterin/6-carboxytetrahydropterin synthase|uniref:6-carboxy-5,6,7,8-tetrahydropterin synthase n=1 Tax=Caldimicrobium thiodismutans TaxID=1653476 RepID=A0A0U4W0V2_9BACT|nr:6-carboxytetrahydropterin synthase QueD [Caldimicrobium thiodismutans]BAU22781.1 6-pyruvoyl tetrahydrobiopterin synthase [Caldimicrobium thiodismutans]
MYRLKVQDHFSSAHYLRNYQGACENLHGHNWKVELVVEGEKLNEIDILLDFKDIKKILKEVLSELDHRLINELPYFQEKNPSSENIARYIFDRVKDKLKVFEGVRVKEVTVFETEKASATYLEE